MLPERLNALNEKLADMASLAKRMIDGAMTSYRNRDRDLAYKVLHDDEILMNKMENENIEEVVKIIALYQPKAMDLRILIAAILINRDLERIGDHAQNIAEYVIKIIELPERKLTEEIPTLSNRALYMLNKSLESLLNGDEDLAKRVIVSDTVMNEHTNNVVINIINKMKEDPSLTDYGIRQVLIARNLERVADHATNIAESVLFVLESKLYLHRKRDIAKESEYKDTDMLI
ncbi:MAG: phosphate signaling complex protein PhoU [bacterium]